MLTSPIAVSGGSAYLNIGLQADVNVYTQPDPNDNLWLEGGTFSGQSLFNNTALLVEAYGHDATGRQVSLGGLTTGGGFQYPEALIASVPEPTSAAFMLLGGVGLCAALRRKAVA